MKYIPVYEGKIKPKWWDCKKALPLCDKGYHSFLTVFNGESGFYAISIFDGKTWKQGVHGKGTEWKETTLVTHWREIPLYESS